MLFHHFQQNPMNRVRESLTTATIQEIGNLSKYSRKKTIEKLF